MKFNSEKRSVLTWKNMMLQSNNWHAVLKLNNKKLSISSELTNFSNVDFKLLPKTKKNWNLSNKSSLMNFWPQDKSVKLINFVNPSTIWKDVLKLPLHQWIQKKSKNASRTSIFLKNKRSPRLNKLSKVSKNKLKASLI